MGQAASRLTRPLRNFNIDNRAAKALSKREKVAEPAPKHATTANKLTQFRAEHPELMEAVSTKDDNLHEKLKDIYLTSTGAHTEIKSAPKPLPLSRVAKSETDLGIMDVDYEMPKGRADLKSILEFLGQHQLNPSSATPDSIARDFKLDPVEVGNILAHYKVLQIHIPQEMYTENKDMKKIVQEQITSTGFASNLRLPGKDTQQQGKPPSDSDPLISPSKT